MTMSSVMLIKNLLRKSSRAACVTREGQARTERMARIKHSTHYYERQNVTISKKDTEAFGFNIRTYENNTTDSTEPLTCVCLVKESSPAESAGVKTGDVILSVNSICVEGFDHQQIVDLIQKSSCVLKMEIVRGTAVKQKELQKKREELQRQLREKREELQTLIMQEERLRGGELRCTQSPSRLASPQDLTLSSGLLPLQT
ncbi:cytohesin-interacting protein [Clarias gariepinus]|uniref:cytohesin-interacting protein-like n=1 Tax=Clarias gariepinus TaxID=13013 RepID=UPI00234CCA8A|nr:cytohesin-interacting protein-like [Clarias gariepinus]